MLLLLEIMIFGMLAWQTRTLPWEVDVELFGDRLTFERLLTTIAKLSGVALFLLVLAVPGEARAHISGGNHSIVITPDNYFEFNGKKTFIVSVNWLCSPYADSVTGENCETSISKNPGFVVQIYQNSLGGTAHTSLNNHGIYSTYDLEYGGDDIISSGWNNEPYYLGFVQTDEPEIPHGNAKPNGYSDEELMTWFDWARTNDPQHYVWLTMCCRPANNTLAPGLKGMAKYADVLLYDTYPKNSRILGDWNVSMSDLLFSWEHEVNYLLYVAEEPADTSEVRKPVIPIIQANGVDLGDLEVMTNAEIRANAYLAVTTDVRGVAFWGYKTYFSPAITKPGFISNDSMRLFVNALAAELTSLNAILTLPTQAYSWEFKKDNIKVAFDPNPTKAVGGHYGTRQRQKLNYILKYNSATHSSYLIVVNKDVSAVNNIQISIDGLTGPMTATTLGLATAGSNPGRVLPVNDGTFSDSFDGYAVHIYEIRANGSGTDGEVVDADGGGVDAENGGVDADNEGDEAVSGGCGCATGREVTTLLGVVLFVGLLRRCRWS